MDNFLAFSSIKSFDALCERIKTNAAFHNRPAPKLTFIGTPKIHGANIGVSQTPTGKITIQTRETIVDSSHDFIGVYQYVQDNLEDLKLIFDRVRKEHQAADKTIYIFSEYFGKGIQSKVGVKFLDKRFAILDIVIKLDDENKYKVGLEGLANYHDLSTDQFMFISQYPQCKVEIDFNASSDALCKIIDRLNDIALEVETDCPVARHHLGPDFKEPLIGEGVVWSISTTDPTLAIFAKSAFKVKGKKHLKVRVSKTPEELQAMDDAKRFGESALSTGRLDQGIFKLQEMLLDPKDPTNMPTYIRWVVGDVEKELGYLIDANQIERKPLNSYIGKMASAHFMANLKELTKADE